MVTTIEAHDFMALLSKVLETAPASDNEVSRSLRDLDKLLRDELPGALNVAGHPNAPGLSVHCTAFQEAMELAVTSRRILDKPVVVLEADSTSQSLVYLKKCVKSPIPPVCLNIDCGIPMLVVHGKTTKMEVINYANSAVSLDLKKEFAGLLKGSRRFKVELARVLRCFVLTIPLKTTAGAFLLLKKETSNIFSRFVALRFLVMTNAVSSKELAKLDGKYTGVLCKKIGKKSNTGVKQVTAPRFAQMMTEQISIPLYGFNEEFAWLSSDILNHFTASAYHSEKLVESLTDDIIRMESSFASSVEKKTGKVKQEKEFDIASIREEAKTAYDNAKDSLKHLKQLISNAKELVNTLLTTFEDGITAPRSTPNDVLEDVFKTFFNAVEAGNSQFYNLAMVRLYTLGYADTALMRKYIRSKKGSTKYVLDADEVARLSDDLRPNDWAKAKMLVELLDIDNATDGLLERLVTPLKGYIYTGKELYALAKIESDAEQRRVYLMASLFKGYVSAGEMLVEDISGSDEDAFPMTLLLAQHLIPAACLAIGEVELGEHLEKVASKKNLNSLPVTIDNPCMLYFKLAASQDSSEALARIADVFFELSFRDVCFVCNRPENLQTALINNAIIICWIANRLMGKGVETEHFAEISGITLFCLNDRKYFVEARRRLSSLKQCSPEASYCLGYMSEHGMGCPKDFTHAVEYYKKALKNGPLTANGESVSKRLSATEQKVAKQSKDQMDSYNDDNSYSSSRSTSSYSSGGGLTMVFLVSLGLSYHSEALEEIWAFRDSSICCTPIGKQLVDEYYRIAPAIRQSIAQSDDPKGICDQLWKDYVQAIQQSIRDGNTQEAVRGLVDMQVELCKKFNLNYDRNLVDQYNQQAGPQGKQSHGNGY